MAEGPLQPHPVFQSIIDAYAATGRPFFHQITPVQAREMLRGSMMAAPAPSGLPELASVTDEAIAGPNGQILVRRYVPIGGGDGVCVYLHAGGWVIGDLAFSDATCRRICGWSRCEIISVEYRLAPEHPFPQPLEDAWAALIWAEGEAAGRPMLIAGESAGGNLAAACAIRARDENGPALAGQVLAYPVTDHDFQTASYQEVGDRNWLLSTADMRWFWDHHAPVGTDRSDPRLSPLRVADAAGLPPAFVAVADLDPLREEGLAYGRKLAEAGVPVSMRCDTGMVHGYLSAAGGVQAANEALEAACRWMQDRIRSAPGPNLDDNRAGSSLKPGPEPCSS